MTYAIKPLPFKPPRLLGLSESLLSDHYDQTYGLSVQQLNRLLTQLPTNKNRAQWHADLLRTSNAVHLQEVYFDSLGGEDGLGSETIDPVGALAVAITHDFGSIARWKADFVATANAVSGNAGWAILSWSRAQNRLMNLLIQDPTHALTNSVSILAIDLCQYAYQADFGNNTSNFIKAFMRNLHWDRAAKRFASARAGERADETPHNSMTPQSETISFISPEQLRDRVRDNSAPILLDVCLADDLPKRHDKLPGARCVQSERIDDWIESIPAGDPVVTYCLYGFQVSSNAATALRERGCQVSVLTGGIAAWRAIGADIESYNGEN